MNLVEELRMHCEFSDIIEIPEEAKSTFAVSMLKAIEPGIGGLWYEPDHQANKFDGNELAFILASRYSELQQFFNGDVTGSPIERRLLGSLVWIHIPDVGFPSCDFFESPNDNIRHFGAFQSPKLLISPQAIISEYRVDFLIWIGFGEKICGVVVECDGHAFHEKTKEQAARDKRRDREILAAGFAVMRFTGSEIFADSHDCAKQVNGVLSDMWIKMAGADGAKVES